MGVIKKAIKSMFPNGNWKILRGDKVVITAGRDKGQTGIVKQVIRDVKIPRVIVEGRNLVRACDGFSNHNDRLNSMGRNAMMLEI
jgi:ribosomal protein L24